MPSVQYFGHSFFKLAFGDKAVLFDPYVSNSCKESSFKRLVPTAAKESDFKNIDLILISHEHFDHFDKDLVEKIAKKNNSCVVASQTVLQEFNLGKHQLHAVGMNDSINLRGIGVKAIAVHHPQAFYPLGFLVSYGGRSVFHAGDTDLIDDFATLSPDVALLPIGGTYTMDVVDAVKAVKTMKPRFAVPMHYNTFKMIEQDPKEFKQKIEKSILKTKPIILKPGQSFSFK
ncbi:MAG: metal-dependent hydrolase [Candidatus Diapherotrites archaeon]|nr:metal-dependent hydrolase [Candidatus Diapherotrites archaeon]